jgi:hypothetical protein
MTHQAVADHFNVSRITISMLMIHLQRHRTARLAWARVRSYWRLHTIMATHLFCDESRFSLSFSDGRYRVYRRHGDRFTDQCVYESDRFGGEVLWSVLEFVMMVALSSNCSRNIECRKIQRRYS